MNRPMFPIVAAIDQAAEAARAQREAVLAREVAEEARDMLADDAEGDAAERAFAIADECEGRGETVAVDYWVAVAARIETINNEEARRG